jgi:hypothetical protein
VKHAVISDKTTYKEIVIPDLEKAMSTFVPREWSQKETDIVKKYYGKVPADLLMKHLPGRTKAAMRSKAQNMGLL